MKTTENVSEINSNINQRKTNSCLTQILTSVQNIFFFFYIFFFRKCIQCYFSHLFPRWKRHCKNKVGSKLANISRFRKNKKPANSLHLIPWSSDQMIQDKTILNIWRLNWYFTKSTAQRKRIVNSLEELWYPPDKRKKNLLLEK